MLSQPYLSLRRIAGLSVLFLLCGAYWGSNAAAQTTPVATASFASGMTHTSKNGWGTIQQTAIDSYGDWLVVDETNGALYEFPAGGGAAETLIAPTGLSIASAGNADPGVAIDSSNNLYLEGGNCILMYPYDTTTSTWDGLPTATSPSSGDCGGAQSFYTGAAGTQMLGLGIGYGATPNLVVSYETAASSSYSITTIPVSGGWAAPVAGAATTVLSGLSTAIASVAEDASGNIYFVTQNSGSAAGLYEIPSKTTGLTSTAGATQLASSLPDITAVSTDSAGDLYISDATEGVFLLPAGFTASTTPLALTPVQATGEVAVNSALGYLYVPTPQKQANGYTGAADVAMVTFRTADFGSVAAGPNSPGVTGFITVTFNGAATPYSFPVFEAGTSTPDFAFYGDSSTCTQGTAFTDPATSAAGKGQVPYTCVLEMQFLPHSVGSFAGKVEILDQNKNVLISIPLHGTGVGGAVQVLPGAQTTMGGGLSAPSETAVDAAGNVFVADPGIGKVLEFVQGSAAGAAGTPIGTGLTSPTGVAVDGAGDVYIADSGSVYEVPETATGLDSTKQVTLTTGLGAHVQLAADGLGDLYISDVDNQKVYELENFSQGWNTSLPGVLGSQEITLTGAAFADPSDIAVDSANNLYVLDGTDVYEAATNGSQTKILSGMNGVTGLAVDPSGSVYVSMSGGTVRIPFETGTGLNPADAAQVATGVAAPAGVALDSEGDIYVTDGSALDVAVTSSSASLNFGTLTADPLGNPPPSGSSAPQTVTFLNYGNMPLSVAGYTDTADYSETSDTCSAGPVAIDSTCTATITFSAGIGDGSTLTGEVLVDGAGNAPVGVNGTGVAPTLANTTTTMTVSSNGTIDGVPVSVTVAPQSGSGTAPTGTVTLTVVPGSNVPVTTPALPSPYTLTATLAPGTGSSSTVSFDPSMLPIGSYTFTARYNGDPTYIYEHSGTSVAQSSARPLLTPTSAVVSVAAASPTAVSDPTTGLSISLLSGTVPLETYQLPCTSGSGSSCTTTYNYDQPSSNAPAYVVLAAGTGSAEDYSGDWQKWDYTWPGSVAPTSGNPMIAVNFYGPPPAVLAPNLPEPPKLIAQDYGAINYEVPSGATLCTSTSDVNLTDGTGAAPLDTSCANIDTSNTNIPDILTYYTVTPVYSGTDNLGNVNPNYGTSKGAAVSYWSIPHPMVQISSSPATLTVPTGKSASATLTLTSVLGYGYAGRGSNNNHNYAMPLDLQCNGLPAYATCTFTYPTPNAADPNFITNPGGLECANSTAASPTYCAIDIGPDPGAVASHASASTPCGPTDGCLGPGSVVMTITSNVPVGTTTSSLDTSRSGYAFAAMFGLGLLGLGFRRKAAKWGMLIVIGCAVACSAGIAGITACGTTNLQTESTAAVTPKGSYWVTVTAKQAGSLIVTDSEGTYLVPGNGNQMSLPYTINVTVQ